MATRGARYVQDEPAGAAKHDSMRLFAKPATKESGQRQGRWHLGGFWSSYIRVHLCRGGLATRGHNAAVLATTETDLFVGVRRSACGDHRMSISQTLIMSPARARSVAEQEEGLGPFMTALAPRILDGVSYRFRRDLTFTQCHSLNQMYVP